MAGDAVAAIKKAVSKEELMQAEKRADRAVAALETVTEVAVAGDAALAMKVTVSTEEWTTAGAPHEDVSHRCFAGAAP